MTAERFGDELARSPALRRVVARYVAIQLAQLAQNAACIGYHLVEARLARWLLMTQDRTHSPAFRITQEFLAFMLGVRRVSVTKAAGALQKRRLIHYVRGTVTVLDRRGLRAAACTCYDADMETYARILG